LFVLRSGCLWVIRESCRCLCAFFVHPSPPEGVNACWTRRTPGNSSWPKGNGCYIVSRPTSIASRSFPLSQDRQELISLARRSARLWLDTTCTSDIGLAHSWGARDAPRGIRWCRGSQHAITLLGSVDLTPVLGVEVWRWPPTSEEVALFRLPPRRKPLRLSLSLLVFELPKKNILLSVRELFLGRS
jgi:hypothetical protein